LNFDFDSSTISEKLAAKREVYVRKTEVCIFTGHSSSSTKKSQKFEKYIIFFM